MKKVLVTGAGGFIGHGLVSRLAGAGWHTKGVYRCNPDVSALPDDVIEVGDISETDKLNRHLRGVDCIVHLAGRSHAPRHPSRHEASEIMRVNAHVTRDLARQAALSGVQRFVFVSSIKVNGERTAPGRMFQPTDPAVPVGVYAVSKYRAEIELERICADTGMEGIVVRPPVVYGPGVKGNFEQLMKLVGRGVPLPLSLVKNKRSFLARDNLVDLMVNCIKRETAPRSPLLASDGVDFSTADVVRMIAESMGRDPRLCPVPPAVLRLGGLLLGRRSMIASLLDSLQIDVREAERVLGWRPLIAPDDAVRVTVESFLAH